MRAVLSTVLLALGAVVLAMTGVAAGGRPVELAAPHVFFAGRVEVAAVPLDLFLLVLLARGLGQSALSVVSLALVGKVAGKQPGVVIGVYSFLVAVGFMAAFMGIKAAFEVLHADWRALWFGPVHPSTTSCPPKRWTRRPRCRCYSNPATWPCSADSPHTGRTRTCPAGGGGNCT